MKRREKSVQDGMREQHSQTPEVTWDTCIRAGGVGSWRKESAVR